MKIIQAGIRSFVVVSDRAVIRQEGYAPRAEDISELDAIDISDDEIDAERREANAEKSVSDTVTRTIGEDVDK